MRNKKMLGIACACGVLAGIVALCYLARNAEQRPAREARGDTVPVPEPAASAAASTGKSRTGHTPASPDAPPEATPAGRDAPAAEGTGNPPKEPAAPPEESGIDIPAELRDKGYLMALFDVNDDERPDLIVYAPEEERIVQVLLGKEDGEFEDSPDARAPDYLASFLSLAAGGEPPEGPVLLNDENGKAHELIVFGGDRP